MSDSAAHAAFIEQIVDLAGRSVAMQDSEAIRRYVAHYYGDVDSDDFLGRDARAWCDLALEHWRFGREFPGGEVKLRIFTALPEHAGASGARTVLEFINDDMPFLVDSIAMEIARQGLSALLLVHPLFASERDAQGLSTRLEAARADGSLESWIHVEIEPVSDAQRLAALEQGLRRVLCEVRAVVGDWPAMSQRIQGAIDGLGCAAGAVAPAEIDDAREFLAWLVNNHFTLQGYRDYDLVDEQGQDALRIVPGSGLGILRGSYPDGLSLGFGALPPEVRALLRRPQILVLTKANSRSTVHRSGYLDYVGVKRFDAAGCVVGERRFVGLYTSSAYHADLQEVPLLRQKLARIMARAGFPAHSHAGKNLQAICATLPRDELLQIDDEQLYATALGILRLGERGRTRLFLRYDPYARFYSCLIFLPRENYNTEIRLKLQDLLLQACGGDSVDFNLQLSESTLARLHMLVRTPDGAARRTLDLKALEAQIAAVQRPWEEGVFEQLAATQGRARADAARQEWVQPMPATYRDEVSVAQAVDDILAMARLDTATPIVVSLYRPAAASGERLGFRLYCLGAAVPLSASLPMLENMGVEVQDERSYVLQRRHATAVHLHDFGLLYRAGAVDLAVVKDKFEQAFTRIWAGQVDSDGFNRLTLTARLDADQIVLLRCYAKYFRQAGFTFSQSYIEQTLARHADITRQLVHLFEVRFDPTPAPDRAAAMASCVATIEAQLDAVASADEDRILRHYLALVQASLRSNYYQRDAAGRRKSYLAIKLESARVPDLPEPRPLYEIFVYSPRFEAIHLRGGKVARGGLRWSDRPEDFRTEVLGLVKAQMVKNAVIVPVGSKGGFVLKAAPPASQREAYLREGIACYQDFLRGLLDLTDNLLQGQLVPPREVVRHDGDDSYLVVAADKGTASFSDYANAISAEYAYWLGDAFASGGSVGYDHKKMGITARGAWESVKRHFRDLGIDTQHSDFTVVGIGDMSGDVFGNGMLLSPHIRLLAAFDHRHIFLDPDADARTSFAERQRLFALPRSSWDDYERRLISAGGGVYARDAKSIALSPQVRAALAIDAPSLTPVELLRAILKAPVDLLYNGGIGTYVKASWQSHASVGDRASDGLRVDGRELRCKVVAEGGNLGCTQLGRIEYALNGGRINTDAIDNSAGVDCSDHEVNIKILLNVAIEAGVLAAGERDALLASMTDEVGLLVLRDNYYQTQSLAVSGLRAERMLDAQARFIRHLEKSARLNRRVEFLPTDEELAERKAARRGLTSPERAVLLAYSKMELYEELLQSDLVDDDYVAESLPSYFPGPLQQRLRQLMARHPLKREIIATQLANATINRTGSVFVHRMREESGGSAAAVQRCYLLAREAFDLETLWRDIDALDGCVAASTQAQMLIDTGRLALRATLWFLRRGGEPRPLREVLRDFSAAIAALSGGLKDFLAADDLAALTAAEQELCAQGVPSATAVAVAASDMVYAALDIVDVARAAGRPAQLAASLYFQLAGRLNLRLLTTQIGALPADSHWQAMARAAMRDDVAALQRQLTAAVLQASPQVDDAAALLAAWEQRSTRALARLSELLDDLQQVREPDLSMIAVLLRELRQLV